MPTRRTGTCSVQINDPANTAPKFADDQDPNTPGKQAVAEREVPENKKTAVGNPVIAFDIDLLMYSVERHGELQRRR